MMQDQDGHPSSPLSSSISTNHINALVQLADEVQASGAQTEVALEGAPMSMLFPRAVHDSGAPLSDLRFDFNSSATSPEDGLQGDMEGYASVPGTSGIGLAPRHPQQIFIAGYGVDPSAVRNTCYDEETTDEGTGEDFSTSPASSGDYPANGESFNELMRCCIAERMDGGVYECCPRRASGIWLSEKLREMSALKRFPYVYNTAKRHYYICLFHRRVIKLEPALDRGEWLGSKQLEKYDRDPYPNAQESIEIADDPLAKPHRRKTSAHGAHSHRGEHSRKRHKRRREKREISAESGSNSDESEEYTEKRPRRSARNHSNDTNTPSTNGKMKDGDKSSKDESRSGEADASADEKCADSVVSAQQIPFNLLSAASLRRYKKLFKLSHRSGASTKQQLLDGVAEHFATLKVPANETVACLLYTVRMNRNRLDTSGAANEPLPIPVPVLIE